MYMQLYLVVMSLLPALNEKNLPWIDVIHPIIVHFVIAMTLIAVVFDIIGIFTKRSNLFEVNISYPDNIGIAEGDDGATSKGEFLIKAAELPASNIGNIPVPIIVRLQGTNAEEAKGIIDNSGLNVHSAVTLKDAAEKVVSAALGS